MTPDAKTVLSIQYLRGLAAILVVVFHASNNAYQFGMAGVDIFFVISGFIMWTTTVGTAIGPADFMRRRLVRIVPLYWAMTLFTAFVSLSPPGVGLSVGVDHLVRSLLFLPANVTQPGNPFLPSPVLGVGWTLNLEMYFYVIFAIGLLLPPRARIALIATVISTPVLLGVFLADRLPLELRFYTRPELLEFVAGVALGAAYVAGKTPRGGAAAAALGAASLLLVASGQPAVDFRALFWGLPALLLCMAGLASEDLLRKRPSRVAKLLGDASYSIYLVHIPMMAVLRKIFGWPSSEMHGMFENLVLAAFTVAGCVVAYFLFEKPVDRALRRRLLKRPAPAPSPAPGS